jgi:hypothetical protein
VSRVSGTNVTTRLAIIPCRRNSYRPRSRTQPAFGTPQGREDLEVVGSSIRRCGATATPVRPPAPSRARRSATTSTRSSRGPAGEQACRSDRPPQWHGMGRGDQQVFRSVSAGVPATPRRLQPRGRDDTDTAETTTGRPTRMIGPSPRPRTTVGLASDVVVTRGRRATALQSCAASRAAGPPSGTSRQQDGWSGPSLTPSLCCPAC